MMSIHHNLKQKLEQSCQEEENRGGKLGYLFPKKEEIN